MSSVTVEKLNNTAIITLNRPETLNAIDKSLLLDLENALHEASQQKDVKVIILTGTGKSFASGGDIASMSKFSAEEAKDFAHLGHRVFNGIAELPQPVIAAVNGYALGGGLELALACDIRIVSSKAKLGLPEVTLGLIPGFGGTQRLSRVVGFSKAFQLISTAKIIAAADAEKLGLADELSEPENLMDDCLALAASIAKNSKSAVALAKRAMYIGIENQLHSSLMAEAECFKEAFTTADHTEGISAFLEKRPPAFTD